MVLALKNAFQILPSFFKTNDLKWGSWFLCKRKWSQRTLFSILGEWTIFQTKNQYTLVCERDGEQETGNYPGKSGTYGCYKYRTIRGSFSIYKGKFKVLNSFLGRQVSLWWSLTFPWPTNCSKSRTSRTASQELFPISDLHAVYCMKQTYIWWNVN